MAGEAEWNREIVGEPTIMASDTNEREGVLHITVNVLNVVASSEAHVGIESTETGSNHYWMNSLPFVKQTSIAAH
jgi:hypothetical protein